MGFYENLLHNLEVIKACGGCDSPLAKEAYEAMKYDIEWRIRESTTTGGTAKNLLKFCQKCLDSVAHDPMLNGAWEADGKQYVCDGKIVIEMEEPLDLPKLENPNPFNVKQMINGAEQGGWSEEIKLDDTFLADLKVAKAKYPKRHYVLHIDRDASINADYLQQAIKSMGALTIHKPTNIKSIYKLENGGTTTIWMLPVKLAPNCVPIKEGQISIF